nr:uncharacterized protein LOC121469597 [Taeniopygia guttata]
MEKCGVEVEIPTVIATPCLHEGFESSFTVRSHESCANCTSAFVGRDTHLWSPMLCKSASRPTDKAQQIQLRSATAVSCTWSPEGCRLSRKHVFVQGFHRQARRHLLQQLGRLCSPLGSSNPALHRSAGPHTAPQLSLGCRQRSAHAELQAGAFHLHSQRRSPSGARLARVGAGCRSRSEPSAGSHPALPVHRDTLRCPRAGPCGAGPARTGRAAWARAVLLSSLALSSFTADVCPARGRCAFLSVAALLLLHRPLPPALRLSPRRQPCQPRCTRLAGRTMRFVCLTSAPGEMRREGNLVFRKEEEEYSNSAAGARGRLRFPEVLGENLSSALRDPPSKMKKVILAIFRELCSVCAKHSTNGQPIHVSYWPADQQCLIMLGRDFHVQTLLTAARKKGAFWEAQHKGTAKNHRGTASIPPRDRGC